MSQLIVLVRHGETDAEVERRLLGSTDVPLNKNGERQARDLARALIGIPLQQVLTSPLSRARITAEAIAREHRLDAQLEPDLREQDFAKLDNKKLEDIGLYHGSFVVSWQADPAEAMPPLGETFTQATARAWKAVGRALKTSYPGNVCLVTHKMISFGILCNVLDLGLNSYTNMKMEAGSYSILEFTGRRLRIALLNGSPRWRLDLSQKA